MRERERERYGDRKIELFEVGRSYTELRERVDRERVHNYSEYLPYVETDVATVVDDNVTYLALTENTKSELNIPNVDRNFEIMLCNNICIISSTDTMEKTKMMIFIIIIIKMCL